MLYRGLLAAAVLSLVLASAGAAAQGFEPFVVRDIRVEGLQRTEPGTVFSYLPVKVGDTVDGAKAQEALRALFATGFFQDVRLEAEGQVLVVHVQERPAIAQIDFAGIKEFEPAEQEIKRQYLTRSLYAAEVLVTVTPLERNRVGINIAVTEGDVAKIRGINIVGAQAFTEKELLDEFTLRTPGWLTWYTRHD